MLFYLYFVLKLYLPHSFLVEVYVIFFSFHYKDTLGETEEQEAKRTSLTHTDARSLAEKRNIPSGTDVEKKEKRYWRSHRRRKRLFQNIRWVNPDAISLTDCVGQRTRFGSNHGGTLMGDVEDTSPKNVEATEGNERCAADENACQNRDEATAPQEFKEPISVSATGIVSDFLKSNTEHKDCDFADLCFLQSLIPGMKKTFRQEET